MANGRIENIANPRKQSPGKLRAHAMHLPTCFPEFLSIRNEREGESCSNLAAFGLCQGTNFLFYFLPFLYLPRQTSRDTFRASVDENLRPYLDFDMSSASCRIKCA